MEHVLYEYRVYCSSIHKEFISNFDGSIWECNGHFNHWFSNTKAFLCSMWNLHKEKLYSLGSSSDLVCTVPSNDIVKGRNEIFIHYYNNIIIIKKTIHLSSLQNVAYIPFT